MDIEKIRELVKKLQNSHGIENIEVCMGDQFKEDLFELFEAVEF